MNRESTNRLSHFSLFFWSSVLLSVLTSFVVLLSIGCFATDQGVNLNTNATDQGNVELPSGGDIIEPDFYEGVDKDLENVIRDISPKLGLMPLTRSPRPEEFELRIWTHLEALADPKLVGFRMWKGENNAYFFDINRHLYSVKTRKAPLASPKSGWNQMVSELKRRLTTPKGLSRDPHFDLNRDEPLILLEVLDKEEYRRVFYGKTTSFPDGTRLIAVCDYLASEFDVNMDCTREHNTR